MKDLILTAAIPFFLLLIALEFWWDRKQGSGYLRLNDAFGSLSLGIVSRTHALVVFSLGGLFIDSVLPQWRLMAWDSSNVWTWFFTFVAYDLSYYWKHRMGHTVNFFWAAHAIHHQSEDYNLTTALRQTSSDVFDWVFYIPLLLLGVPLEVFLTCGALNLIYQFWVHTQHIDKLGWMEKVMVTPSNHRVHHGQNPEYIDKNHGGVFVIWDRLFGSFQPELDDVEIIYGVRRPLNSLNPLWANVYVWQSLLFDAVHTKRWWDKLRLWFMPTGWRPADMEARYPIAKSDLARFEKYDPAADTASRGYAILQLAAAVPLLVYFVTHFTGLSYALMLLGFVMITLPLMTSAWLLEARSSALKWEVARLLSSGVGFVLAWPIMATSSVAIFGGYLALNSLAYLVCFGWRWSSQSAMVEAEAA